MSYNASSCAATGGIEVLPVANGSVCGVRSLQKLSLEKCCNGELRTYHCQQYCLTSSGVVEWNDCVSKNSNITDFQDIFCQAQVYGNNTQTVKPKDSAAFTSASAPSKSYVLIFLLLSTFLIGSTTAKVIPSLATAKQLASRQSSPQITCSIEVLQDYTVPRSNSLSVASAVSCDLPTNSSKYCGFGFNINSGINSNNRTINGTTAAEPKFDSFFDLLANRTGHLFPALSSVEFAYSFLAPPGISRLAFTPVLRCIDVMITGCGGIIGDTNGTTPILACGPEFVEEPRAGADISDAAIQGIISVVQTVA